MRIVTHAVLLSLTIFTASFIAKIPLQQYDLTIAAVLFMTLFILKRFTFPTSDLAKMAESIVFTGISVYIVMATGKSGSPFFFLLYFLLFSLSLMLEPAISLTTTLVLVMILVASLDQQPSFSAMLPIFSLAFLTPFAMLLGQEYVQMQELQKKTLREEKQLHTMQEELAQKIRSMQQSIDSLKDSDAKEHLIKDLASLRSHVNTHE